MLPAASKKFIEPAIAFSRPLRPEAGGDGRFKPFNAGNVPYTLVKFSANKIGGDIGEWP